MKKSTIPLIIIASFFGFTAWLFSLIGFWKGFGYHLAPALLPSLLPMFNWEISMRTLVLMDVLGIGIVIYLIVLNEKG